MIQLQLFFHCLLFAALWFLLVYGSVYIGTYAFYTARYQAITKMARALKWNMRDPG